MATRYAPLVLPAQLHDFPLDYDQRLLEYDDTREVTTKQHVDKVSDFVDLEEVDHDDVKIKLFA